MIEAPVEIDGLPFVFSDTAGLRDAGDAIEDEGVRRARDVSDRADIVLWLGEPEQAPDSANMMRVAPKADLDGERSGNVDLAVSAVSGEGMTELRTAILARAKELLPRDDQLALNIRQRTALTDAAEKLASAQRGDWILLSETLRQARADLDRLTGRGGVEDMLDALFGRFCIGK